MNKTIKFEMPDRDPGEETESEEAGLKIDVDPSGKEPTLFRSRWSELRGSEKPKSLWRTPAGVRLLFLCVLLVMVIWAMSQAGKPESWNWLFKLDSSNIENKEGSETASLDSDTAASLILADPSLADPSQSPAGRVGEENLESDEIVPTENDFSFVTNGSKERIEVDFWRSFLKSLNGKQQVRLFWLLDSVTHQRKLPIGETSAINPVFRKLAERRQRLHQSLRESGNTDVSIQDDWQNQFLPALKSVVIDQEENVAATDDSFLRTVGYIRKAADSLVSDKTPIERPREAYAWFAAWSDVFDAPLEQTSQQQATVTQLLSQPNAYRGEWIAVSGTVLRVNEVTTSNNPLGIERYYVMWIKPDHPSSFPFCVYSLMAPEAMLQQAAANQNEVEIPIRTTARFFKNRIFPSEQPAFAPVLMTANVKTIRQVDAVPSKSSIAWLSRSNWVLMMGIIGGFAVLIAWSVFRSTLGSAARSLPKSDFLSDNFSQLQEDERVETTREKLLRLSQTELSSDEFDNPGKEPSEKAE